MAKKAGRPPAGLVPGEYVSQYPQFVVRLPPEKIAMVKALAKVQRKPQWRVVFDVLTFYFAKQDEEDQTAKS